MISSPTVSVIIPCFNTPEEYIVRAYKSVIMQKNVSFEIILVDDGSSLSYHKVLEKLSDKDDRIRLITTDNRGVSAARNIAVNNAVGQYVAFLDSDDVITRGSLEKACLMAESLQADYIIGGVKNATEINDEDLLYINHDKRKYRIYEGKKIEQLKPCLLGPNYQICFDDCYINRGPVARLLKTDLAKKAPFDPSIKLGEDVVWNQELLKQCNKVCIVNDVWYIYWHNPQSASYQYSEKYILEWEYHLTVLQNIIDLHDSAMFSSYCSRILEGMENIWLGYLRQLKNIDKELYKKLYFRLYKSSPWNNIAASKKLNNTPGKMKIKSYLYKLRLLFVIWTIMERKKH